MGDTFFNSNKQMSPGIRESKTQIVHKLTHVHEWIKDNVLFNFSIEVPLF